MTDDQQGEDTTEGMDAAVRSALSDYDFPDNLLESGRERGLSKNDRRFLVTGETRSGTPNESVQSNTRTRIRKRIRETIVDFWLISVYLDDYDRNLIFDKRGPIEDWEFREGIKNTMQFFYTGLDGSDLMDFETALTSAIHDAERERHRGPVLVETEFDVDVNEQFRVQEAYEKFQKGAPLEPMEVGALLVTGRVTDLDEVARLAQHARGQGLIESSVSPLLAEQLSDVYGGPATERLYSTLAHLPDTEGQVGPDEELPEEPLRSRDLLDWDLPDPDSRPATRDDLPNADIDDEAEPLDESDGEEGNYEDHDTTLRRLSTDLGEPITVADEVVYEDGDRHSIEQDDEDSADADR
jgi:hypothetical protein